MNRAYHNYPKIQTIAFLLYLSFYMRIGFSQFQNTTLDENKTRAFITNGGTFFYDNNGGSIGYEYPKSSGKGLINALSFWFSSSNINGGLSLSAQMYDLGLELTPGALDSLPGYGPVAPHQNNLLIISKAEIENHINSHTDPNYIIPPNILNWPAHGDTLSGFSFYLAPFVDSDNDKIYKPENGDYPLIRGDKATYCIMHDYFTHQEFGGFEPVGLECHFMFYQFSDTVEYLESTTFVNIKIIQRKGFHIMRTGCFTDCRLGDETDNFIGSDSSRHLMYCYNGSNIDSEYGTNPPAFGVVNLSENTEIIGGWDDITSVFPDSTPVSGGDVHDYMNGYWNNVSHFTYGANGSGGSVLTNYLYSGDPNLTNSWSEIQQGNQAGDRKMFMASSKNPMLAGGPEICKDFAIIVADDGDHLQNVTRLFEICDSVKSFFNDQAFICSNYESFLEINEDPFYYNRLKTYPNPVREEFFVEFPGEFEVDIFTIDGRLILSTTTVNKATSINLSGLESGPYILVIKQNDQSNVQKIIKN